MLKADVALRGGGERAVRLRLLRQVEQLEHAAAAALACCRSPRPPAICSSGPENCLAYSRIVTTMPTDTLSLRTMSQPPNRQMAM